MTYNKLELNPDKIEFLLIGTASNRAEFTQIFRIDLLGSHPVIMLKTFELLLTLILHSWIMYLLFAERVSMHLHEYLVPYTCAANTRRYSK